VRATDSATFVASHEACLLHEPFPGHPERPRRLAAALAGALDAGARPLTVALDEDAALAAIARVHAPGLPARLREACTSAPRTFDSDDNPISAGTYRAAIAAVATCVAAVDAVASGAARRVFAAARPPGHHALRDRALGFCFFNNAAIAAEALLARGLGPLAIVDFDVHHGNGTQDHFYARRDVFFLSVHAYPEFPGTGAADETGAGEGAGFTRNVPLATGFGDDVFAEAVALGLREVRAAMRPAAWVVSAGFDAHRDDPVGRMAVSEGGFAAAGRALTSAAGGTPVVAVLEGGYDLKALQRSICAFLTGLQGDAAS